MAAPHTGSEIRALLEMKYGELTYDDASHIYRRDDGIILPSITTVKKKVVGEFDPGIAGRMAGKRNVTREVIQAEWDAIRDCGTLTHELLEAILFNGVVMRPTDHSTYSALTHARFLAYKRVGLVSQMINAMRNSGIEPVAAEFQVWCDTAAGTLDILGWDDANACYRVVDWKTNGPRPFNEEGPWTKYLGKPFEDFKGTKVAEFSVQLESYAAMLASVLDVEIGSGLIIHGRLHDEEFGDVMCFATQEMRSICNKWLQLENT